MHLRTIFLSNKIASYIVPNPPLSRYLTKIVKSDWKQKLYMLYIIIAGLDEIHQQNLIHCDFHDGNILNHGENGIYISDLGLCHPIQSSLEKDKIIFMVLYHLWHLKF